MLPRDTKQTEGRIGRADLEQVAKTRHVNAEAGHVIIGLGLLAVADAVRDLTTVVEKAANVSKADRTTDTHEFP